MGVWSATACVRGWVESRLGVWTGTYPPAAQDAPADFAVVDRVGGEVSYPHDSPRIAVQVWTGSDAEGEQAALALCLALPTLADADPRVNGVGEPTLVSLGRDDNGRFVWQLDFRMECNIRIEQEA